MPEVIWVRYQFHNYIHAGYKLLWRFLRDGLLMSLTRPPALAI